MLGIAIINYKTYQKTIECIDSIRNTTQVPYRIYLLENGSGNESGKYLKNVYNNSCDVELIVSETNHGYARGNNILINRMIEDKCEFGLVTNNDIICQPESIDRLVSDLEKKEDYLLIGPKIVSPLGDFQQSIKLEKYSNTEYLLKSTYLHNFAKKDIEIEIANIKKINSFTEVSWVSGAFFIFDIQKMIEIELFDPNTFLFFEEYILSEKAKRKGFKLGYEPKSKVVHFHAVSTGGGANVISKKAADTSEKYYFNTYTNVSVFFKVLLRIVRILEVLYTFGKKKDWKSIRKYFEKNK